MSQKFEQLRKEAAKFLQENDVNISQLSNNEVKRILHELEVHQIELEIQNEELTETKAVLEKTKNKYLALFEYAPIGYLVIDRNKNIQEVNFTFCALIGWAKNDVMGKPFSNFISHDYQDVFFIKFRQTSINTSPTNSEIKIISRDKEPIWVKFELIKQDTTDDYLLSITKIDEQKEAESKLAKYSDELKQLNGNKDLFLKILSHDLRSPFNSILGFLKLLISNIHKYDINKIIKMLNITDAVANNAYNLLNDLLMWSQSQSGKMPLHLQRVIFYTIYEEVVLPHVNNDKQIAINFDGDKTTVIEADPNMLKTILRNLISNAIKYTDSNGNIDVNIKQENNSFEISVSDTGMGISPENQQKLWKPLNFYSTVGTNGEHGRGFGLTFCKEFIEQHGGKIWVESEVGKGSVFKFRIPLPADL